MLYRITPKDIRLFPLLAYLLFFTTMGHAATNYVSLGGSHTPPYDTWAKAATNIQDAINVATEGNCILVTNGVYTLSSQVLVTNNILLQSVNGYSSTIIDGNGSCRCLYIDNAETTVQGFSFINGYDNDGAGIYCVSGTVSECRIANNTVAPGPAIQPGHGGGVYCQASTLSNCLITNNLCEGGRYNSGYGGGCYAIDSAIQRCTIKNNDVDANELGFGYGGGLFLRQGTLEDSQIANNRARASSGNNGCGLYAESNAIVQRCVITDNHDDAWGASGGGVYCCNVTIQNSIIANNDTIEMGAGIYSKFSSIVNCTIVSNSSHYPLGVGGLVFGSSSTALNTIVYFNTPANCESAAPSSKFINCCATPSLGSGNITNNPDFIGAYRFDFHLKTGSHCIDAGSNANAPTNDIEMTHRPLDGDGDALPITDIGACEAPDFYAVTRLTNGIVTPPGGSPSNTFDFSVEYVDPNGSPPLIKSIYLDGCPYEMSLQSGAASSGTYTYVTVLTKGSHSFHYYFTEQQSGGLWYPATASSLWVHVYAPPQLSNAVVNPIHGMTNTTIHFSIDYFSTEGAPTSHMVYISGTPYAMNLDSGTASNGTYVLDTLLAPGRYEYYFQFTDIHDQQVRAPETGSFSGLTVNCDTHYVSLSGNHQWPYASWDDAATNIQPALDAATNSHSVVATNGSYTITHSITLTNAIHLRSMNGSATTTIDAEQQTRCVYMNNEDAICEGFTITGGAASEGGGALCVAGSLSNCVFASNISGNGGGLLIQSGTVIMCDFISNSATNDTDWTHGGGAVYCDNGGVLRQCTVISNTAYNGGGIFMLYGGHVENSLLSRNSADAYGGGLFCRDQGIVELCTIAGNSAGSDAGGIGLYGSYIDYVRNSIIYDNTVAGTNNNYNDRTGMDYSFCCLLPIVSGTGNLTNAPQFVDPSSMDYTLTEDSPCVDSGTNISTLCYDVHSVSRPLDGNNNGVCIMDIGCCEFISALADSDQDGLTDSNEVFDVGSDPAIADTDQDQQTDGNELIAGTDPLNPSSVFEVEQCEAKSETGPVISWSSVLGHLYTVSQSTNQLVSWSVIETNIAATPPKNSYTGSASSATAVYRILVE